MRVQTLLAALLVPVGAIGQVDAGAGTEGLGLCKPSRDHAAKVTKVSADLMKLVSSQTLQAKRDLSSMKQVAEEMPRGVTMLKCDEAAFEGKELADLQAFEARLTKWSSDETAVLAAEEKGRQDVVIPLCEAIWTLDDARAEIAHEKANPGGVVDLHELHVAGEAVQNAQENIALLKPLYRAFRHHAFTTWQSEGACVAASTAAN